MWEVDPTFEGEDYTQVQPTLDEIARRLSASIVIEDLQGRLLFSGGAEQPDDWRDDFTPFAYARHPRRQALLDRWMLENDHDRISHVPLNAREDRVVFPLTYRGENFMLVNITARKHFDLVRAFAQESLLDRFGDKIYMVMMGSINAVRRRLILVEDVEESTQPPYEVAGAATNYRVISLQFPEISALDVQDSLVDYASIAVWHAQRIAERIVAGYPDGVDHCCLLTEKKNESSVTVVVLESGEKGLGEESDVFVSCAEALASRPSVSAGIGPRFSRPQELMQRAWDAFRVRSMGVAQDPTKRVFQQQDLGMEAFLAPIMESEPLRQYAEILLRGLLEHDEVLLRTLVTYLREDCSTMRTAEAMGLDRRTITYRLERISQALELDMSSLQSRFLVYIALNATRLM